MMLGVMFFVGRVSSIERNPTIEAVMLGYGCRLTQPT